MSQAGQLDQKMMIFSGISVIENIHSGKLNMKLLKHTRLMWKTHNGKKNSQKMAYFGSTPGSVRVTTKTITFLAAKPYKPSFATVTGWRAHSKSYFSWLRNPKPAEIYETNNNSLALNWKKHARTKNMMFSKGLLNPGWWFQPFSIFFSQIGSFP